MEDGGDTATVRQSWTPARRSSPPEKANHRLEVSIEASSFALPSPFFAKGELEDKRAPERWGDEAEGSDAREGVRERESERVRRERKWQLSGPQQPQAPQTPGWTTSLRSHLIPQNCTQRLPASANRPVGRWGTFESALALPRIVWTTEQIAIGRQQSHARPGVVIPLHSSHSLAGGERCQTVRQNTRFCSSQADDDFLECG